MSFRTSLAVLALLLVAAPTFAQQSGSFVVRLGNDTTSVERYTRSAKRIEVEQVGRVPRVLQRRFVYDLASSGATTHATFTATVPGSAAGTAPFQTMDANLVGDSVITVGSGQSGAGCSTRSYSTKGANPGVAPAGLT